MYCQNCGRENVANARFCVACGLALITVMPVQTTQYYGQQAQLPQQPYAYQQYYQQPVYCTPSQENSSSKGLGITGVVFGIAGIVLACVPYLAVLLGATGLAFSISGKRAALQGEQSSSVTAGIALSIVAVGISLMLIALDVMFWAITGTGIFNFWIGDFHFGFGERTQ